jgi:signal transduction histidine kinase
MKKLNLPGGILPLFRMFIGLRLLWSVFMLLGTLGRASIRIFEGSAFTGLAECVLLLGYLSWPWLEKRLGKYYLPVGLCIATLGPWLENQIIYMSISSQLSQLVLPAPFTSAEMAGLLILVTQMQSLFVLFVPLILISWQYSLKWVIAYILGIAALDFIPIYWIVGPLNNLSSPAGIVIRTVLFLMTGFVVNRLATEQKEHNRQLSQYAATLEQLSTSRERNRLAREIHDTLAHALSGLAVNLEAVTALWDSHPAQAKDILKQSLAVTRSGLVETRRAIQALRAGPLEDLGLTLALKQLALSCADRYNLKADLNLPEKLDELDMSVEQCVFRVAEEGLRNLGQHARASQFSMSLMKKDEQLEFVISDDGSGFENSSELQEGHFGIKGMRERAETVGGTLNISSQPGQGTTLRLVI